MLSRSRCWSWVMVSRGVERLACFVPELEGGRVLTGMGGTSASRANDEWRQPLGDRGHDHALLDHAAVRNGEERGERAGESNAFDAQLIAAAVADEDGEVSRRIGERGADATTGAVEEDHRSLFDGLPAPVGDDGAAHGLRRERRQRADSDRDQSEREALHSARRHGSLRWVCPSQAECRAPIRQARQIAYARRNVAVTAHAAGSSSRHHVVEDVRARDDAAAPCRCDARAPPDWTSTAASRRCPPVAPSTIGNGGSMTSLTVVSRSFVLSRLFADSAVPLTEPDAVVAVHHRKLRHVVQRHEPQRLPHGACRARRSRSTGVSPLLRRRATAASVVRSPSSSWFSRIHSSLYSFER